MDEIRQAERDAARRTDMLTYQIQEIEAARLHTGEEESLREERNRLANAEGPDISRATGIGRPGRRLG